MSFSHRTIHDSHFDWDNSLPPRAVVAPGAKLLFNCKDSASGHFNAASTVAAMETIPHRGNPLTGPIHVEGAKPGDILKVTIEEFIPSGFGWTAIIPGYGLLQDDFNTPELLVWTYDPVALGTAAFSHSGKVPLKPFAGCMGVAPATRGVHSVLPPRRVGGNLDIRDLGAGSVLYLPVEVAGALFSVGDTHAAQGDGEVCGTAIESAMDVVLRFELIKQTPLATPRFMTPGSVTGHADAKGYAATTGIGPDLMTGAQAALRNMIDLLVAEQGISPEHAYMLCSVCGDLRISEIVDQPNWVVSFYFPRSVFE